MRGKKYLETIFAFPLEVTAVQKKPNCMVKENVQKLLQHNPLKPTSRKNKNKKK